MPVLRVFEDDFALKDNPHAFAELNAGLIICEDDGVITFGKHVFGSGRFVLAWYLSSAVLLSTGPS